MILLRWKTFVYNRHFHEKVFFFSFSFIFIILSCDCWFKNLPLSGYGVIFISILLVATTFLWLRHELKILLLYPKYNEDSWKKLRAKWYYKIFKRKENIIFDNIVKLCSSSLNYPTSINEQMRLLIKDIEKEFVKPWYAELSTNPAFLFDCHLVLEECLFKMISKSKSIHWKFVIKSIVSLYLNHLQEYKRYIRRAKTCDINIIGTNEELTVKRNYRFVHPTSQNDHFLNHYLAKIVEFIFHEYTSHEFALSIEGFILIRILARKMLKTLLVNVEDPAWLYLRLFYVVDEPMYKSLILDKSYMVYEITEVEPIAETSTRFRINSRTADMSCNIFDRTLGSKVFNTNNGTQKKMMSLSLATAKPEANISSVLGNIISSTAAPLLPDNASLCYQPLNKMWLSPVTEIKQEISDAAINSLNETLSVGSTIDAPKENGAEDKFEMFGTKVLPRSKSSDAMSPSQEAIGPPKRDVSFGEELNEASFIPEESGRRLVKTHSFDAGSADELPCGPGPQGDVSPVYEEPEDFATTIAKLRNILQQRESTSTISDKSTASIDSQDTFSKENTFDSGDKFQAHEGLLPESNIACDIPTDGRPFVNVCIPSTEVHESSNSSYVLYTIQYDGIYVKQTSDDGSQLVLQTTVVKRRFQEFLNLQTRLEENSALKQHVKGIKGPSKWMNLPFGTKTDEATTAIRRPVLEAYLQQLCSKLEIATSPALQEFLAYGSNAVTSFSGKNSNSSIQKIDKFLSTKVTGVFNSIKTVLPSFETPSLISPALDAKEIKPFMEQNLLQGFLNFGNKSEEEEIFLNFIVGEATGNSLTDDVRHFLSEKSDCIEDALDVLDNSNWHSEEGECQILSSNGCVWQRFKDAIVDDDVDKFDVEAPVLNILIDVLCELLETTDCFLTKELIIHIIKTFAVDWEKIIETHLSSIDWNRTCGNILRLLRLLLFSPQKGDPAGFDCEILQAELHKAILNAIPVRLLQMFGSETLDSALTLFLNSLRYSKGNRDILLRFMDILISQLLSCTHLSL